jgi:hypothetical protein
MSNFDIFVALPASAGCLSDDNIKEFLEWTSTHAREVQPWQASKVYERLVGDARLISVPIVLTLVKAALTLLWGWDADPILREVDLEDGVVFHATRTLECAFDWGCASGPCEEEEPEELAASVQRQRSAALPPKKASYAEPEDAAANSTAHARDGDDKVAKYMWTKEKEALPERLQAIWDKNPLGAYNVRRRIVSKLPQLRAVGQAPPFPEHAGLRPHYLDQQYLAWDNRSRDILRGLTFLHWKLSGEVPPLPEELSVEDLLEGLFGLTTALSKSLEQGRKSLVDKRFKALDTQEEDVVPLFSQEDMRHLEKIEKLRRTMTPAPRKGFGGKGKGFRYQPYGGNGAWGGRGQQTFGKGKGKGKGKGGKGTGKFSFLQVYNDKQ